MSRQTQQRTRARLTELSGHTFVLQITPERAPGVSRTLELRQSDTLEDLHDAIQTAFALDGAHPYSFFLSGKAWDPKDAYDGPGKGAGRTTLHAAGLHPGQRFLYLFDYGDELRHLVTVESAGAAETGVGYPRTLSGVGEPPPQYEDIDDGWEPPPPVAEDLLGLGAEVAGAARDAMGRMESAGSALPGRAQLLREQALAGRLHGALTGRPEQLGAIEAAHDVDLAEWLSDLIFNLAEEGFVDEALALHGSWAELMEIEDFIGDRALLLARAGRTDSALAEARRCLEAAPDDPEALDRAAEIFQRCGEVGEAERLSRQVLEQSKDPILRGAAADRLIERLQQTGRKIEAAEMARAHEQMLQEAGAIDLMDPEDWDDGDEGWDEAGLPPIVAQATPAVLPPKAGRNDPCPCGSGKKHKKCCGV